MQLSTCPEHGNLVLDLARGRLSDADAAHAETVRGACPHCASWWNTTFADDATAAVDAAVAGAFNDFQPVGGRRYAWLVAAAAAVLAVGVGVTTMLWRGGETSPVVATQGPAAEAVLSTWDFEGGDIASTIESAAVPTPAKRGQGGEAVFVNDLESGDLGAWSFHS